MNHVKKHSERGAKPKRHLLRRVLLCAAGGALALAVAVGTWIYFTQPVSIGSGNPVQITLDPQIGNVLTAVQAQADRQQMIAFVESVHPMFLGKPTADYQAAKKAYIAATQDGMTVEALRTATSRYLTSLHDGHTHMVWTDTAWLGLDWQWRDGQLVSTGKTLPAGAVITAIGGIPMSTLKEQIGALFPAENDAAVTQNMETKTRSRAVLFALGAPHTNQADITLEGNGRPYTLQVPYQNTAAVSQNQSNITTGRLENGVFIVTMPMCEQNTSFEQTAAALKKAVAGGVNKVVIDVRGNPGGNSQVDNILLDTLGMKPGEYGGIVRFSKAAKQQRGLLQQSGSIRSSPSNQSKPNPKIQLRVLTDYQTFSSATMLAVFVQDGKLGKVVGQPSANKPSCYGDVLTFQLAYSRLYGSVSFKKWTRPDASKDSQPELVPDIPVPEGQDALAAAMESFD